jgi:hypothetical protein
MVLLHLRLQKAADDQLDLLRKPDDVKALGICWDNKLDCIHFKVKDPSFDVLTKRSVLSQSTLFDPLGLVTPVTVRAKIALHDIWRMKEIGWDDVLPPSHARDSMG